MHAAAPGRFYALAATVVWSGNFVASRAVADLVPPWQCNFARWLIALIVLLPFALREVRRDWAALRRHWAWLSIMAVLGVTLLNTLIYQAAHTTESLNMALLVPTAPVVMLIGSRLLYGEPLTPRRLAGMGLVLIGVILVVSRGDWERLAALRFNPGDFLALGGALCFGFYSLLMRCRPPDISALSFNAATFALGLIFALPGVLIEAAALPSAVLSPVAVAAVLYAGVGCSCLAFWLWTLAVDRVGAARAGMVYYSLPVFAAAEAALLLGERIAPLQVVGGVLIVGGILAAVTEQIRTSER